uniref:Saposin B-type domain-containing protein n=1 Tax=Plectus sambesii TaxID=2011161 RepID=A0A914W9T4_9BILA
MHFISTVCLLSVAVIAAFAQTQSSTCHMCELIVNDVLALHPNGLNGVSDTVLMADLNNECEKYWSQQAAEDKGCHDWLAQNGASFIAAMRVNSNAYAACHAAPASVC